MPSRTNSSNGSVRRRQRKSSSHYNGRRPYSSSRYADSYQINALSARLPSFIILSAFAIGWLLGRHEGTRGMGVHFTLQSKDLLQSVGHWWLVFMGLAVGTEECESIDGRENLAFCSIPELIGKLTREQVMLERRMQSTKEYGPYYHQIFNDLSTKASDTFPNHAAAIARERNLRRQPRQPHNKPPQPKAQTPIFLAKPDSTNKLTRRILIKHLQAVLRDKSVSSSNTSPPTFTWITAGDATAAAHGNLFAQSYTSVLQDTVGDAFQALGIHFRAENYGMGQYSSGPELGLCMNEVFGDDIDILMWDFASLQPEWEPTRRSVLWANRAGLHPTRPILFSFDTFGERSVNLEYGTTGSILMDADAMQTFREKMPDSNVVMNLPDGLRNYRCGNTIEGGLKCEDTVRNFVCYLDEDEDDSRANSMQCRDNKFRTKPECNLDARYQVSWHPGWKDHMLKGRLIGHFLMGALEDSLYELKLMKSQYGDDPSAILAQLRSLDDRERQEFLEKPPDTSLWDEDGIVSVDMGSAMVLRGGNICHTALLPSRSRLEGITTETEDGSFDRGQNQFLMSDPRGTLPLAFDSNDRQQCDLLEVDHKDFFIVREQDEDVSALVPNDTELQVYKRTDDVQGIIVLCLKICPLNKCPETYIDINEVSGGTKLLITVDNQPVTKVLRLDTCHILAGEQGIRWGTKDQYELKFRIAKGLATPQLKISSIIVF